MDSTLFLLLFTLNFNKEVTIDNLCQVHLNNFP